MLRRVLARQLLAFSQHRDVVMGLPSPSRTTTSNSRRSSSAVRRIGIMSAYLAGWSNGDKVLRSRSRGHPCGYGMSVPDTTLYRQRGDVSVIQSPIVIVGHGSSPTSLVSETSRSIYARRSLATSRRAAGDSSARACSMYKYAQPK